jgi:signal transduction histidine kinase
MVAVMVAAGLFTGRWRRVRARQRLDALRQQCEALESRLHDTLDALADARRDAGAARLVSRRAAHLSDRLLGIVSHELRTPLNAIVGWAHVLRAGAVRDAGRAISGIDRNARRQARLIDELLEMAQLSRGRPALVTARIDLRQIARDASLAVSSAIREKEIDFVSDESDEPVMVWGDGLRLQHAVAHLLSNGVKYSYHGGRLRMSVWAEADRAVLVVHDYGQGIDREFLGQLFQPFTQGASASPRVGLGLGLAIVRETAERHGGSVTGESAGRDAGARFRLELPLHHDEDEARAALGTSAAVG